MSAQAQPSYGQPPPVQTTDLQAILSQINRQPPPQMQTYGYGNVYQAENDRKRQLDHDDQGNSDPSFNKGKRQKGEGKKKVFSHFLSQTIGLRFEILVLWRS